MFLFCPRRSKHFPALDQADEDDDDGDDEEDVNEAAERVSGDDTEQPENDQNDGNGPEHKIGVKNKIRLYAGDFQKLINRL